MTRKRTVHSPLDRRRRHKVGLLASVLGMLALLLPFASVSRSRIATGESVHAWEVMPPALLVLLAVPWLAVAAVSLRRGGRAAAFARGMLGGIAIGLLLGVSGAVAAPAVADLGGFARYSLGTGVWVSVFVAFALIVGSRREVGAASVAGWAVSAFAPALVLALMVTGRLTDLGMAAEYGNVSARFGPAVLQHVAYAATAIGIATVLGVLLGVWAFRNRRLERPIFTVVSVFQTIPGLAMVGILVAPLAAIAAAVPQLREFGFGGLGWAPLVVALTLYALLAVVGNTYAGLTSVADEVVDAGHGMGMTDGEVMRRVQLPLARPVLFSGIRTASQQTVGNATLGAFVAAGGLGPFIFQGLAQQANDLVLLGSVALVTLALSVDILMRAVQHAVTPRNLRKGHRS